MELMMLCDESIFARTWGAPDAPTVLCWHGAGGSSLDFAPVATELAERLDVRVVAIDAPGHSQSATRPAEAFSPSALAKLATQILDELAVKKAVFLGFSWGASVGCWLCAPHPERTLALALVEGGHFDFSDLPDFRTDRSLRAFISEAEAVANSEGAAFGSHAPAVAGAMVYGLCREPATDTYSRLAASGTPVLFVGAPQAEPSLPVQRLSRLVPQTQIIRLPSPRHELLQDAPRDVAREVGDWLVKLVAD
jgi:pimeloyl-ACP methyl ester carboxylesterase